MSRFRRLCRPFTIAATGAGAARAAPRAFSWAFRSRAFGSLAPPSRQVVRSDFDDLLATGVIREVEIRTACERRFRLSHATLGAEIPGAARTAAAAVVARSPRSTIRSSWTFLNREIRA